jgi:hypothetical protein
MGSAPMPVVCGGFGQTDLLEQRRTLITQRRRPARLDRTREGGEGVVPEAFTRVGMAE